MIKVLWCWTHSQETFCWASLISSTHTSIHIAVGSLALSNEEISSTDTVCQYGGRKREGEQTQERERGKPLWIGSAKDMESLCLAWQWTWHISITHTQSSSPWSVCVCVFWILSLSLAVMWRDYSVVAILEAGRGSNLTRTKYTSDTSVCVCAGASLAQAYACQ